MTTGLIRRPQLPRYTLTDHGVRVAVMCAKTHNRIMMSHLAEPAALAEQTRLMESYGAHCVYVTDSGGRLTMDGVRERVGAYRDRLDPPTQIGIHAHHNLALGVANSVVAVEAGAYRVDTSLAGRAPATARWRRPWRWADLTGWEYGCDLFALMDAADDLVRRRPLDEHHERHGPFHGLR